MRRKEKTSQPAALGAHPIIPECCSSFLFFVLLGVLFSLLPVFCFFAVPVAASILPVGDQTTTDPLCSATTTQAETAFLAKQEDKVDNNK